MMYMIVGVSSGNQWIQTNEISLRRQAFIPLKQKYICLFCAKFVVLSLDHLMDYKLAYNSVHFLIFSEVKAGD